MPAGRNVSNVSNGAMSTSQKEQNLCENQAKDLSSNHAENMAPNHNGSDNANNHNFNLHAVFQQQQHQHAFKHAADYDAALSNSAEKQQNGGCTKTYTELKLYNEQHGQNMGDALRKHLEINSMADKKNGVSANNLDQISDNESDGSDSEEIDLTSGTCIDFSNSKPQKVEQPIGAPNCVH